MRILGGSLGISTSTVFLNNKVKEQLSGLLSPLQEATLGQTGAPLSAKQRTAVHKAFSEAFHNDMVASAAISGAAILVVFGAYRRGRMLMIDQKNARIREEIERRTRLAQASGNDAAPQK